MKYTVSIFNLTVTKNQTGEVSKFSSLAHLICSCVLANTHSDSNFTITL